MKVSCEKLRELKLLRDYEIIDFYEDEDSSDVYIVYADREVRDNSVEVHAVLFDIEKENLEFSPRNYEPLPPEREEAEIRKALARRERLISTAADELEEDEDPFPF